MKRILFIGTAIITVVLALILWGLVKSPQFSGAVSESTRRLKVVLAPQTTAESQDVALKLKQEKEAFAQLMTTIEVSKTNYETTLKEYKVLDKNFTALIMSNRKNPEPEKVKAAESILNSKFEELNAGLKDYQNKTTELYRFQSKELTGSTNLNSGKNSDKNLNIKDET